MGDELSLLWKIRGDTAGLKTATAESRAAVAQLRQSFGPELAQAVGVGQKALQSLGGSVEQLVVRQLPLLGNVVASVSSGLRQVATAAIQSKASVDGAGLSFAEIGAITGRTEAQVAGFVASLGLLKTEAAKNTAVVGFLGGALASNLRPQLDEAAKAGAELNRIFQASGKSTDEALRLVQALGLIGDATQRNAAAVSFFGETTARRLLPQLEKFGASLSVIAAASGRSGAEVTEFIARFARLGTEVEKRTAAVEFFGASLATKLGPELSKTSAALAGVSSESAAAGSAMAGMAGPIGIAVLAVAALGAGVAIAAKQIFELTKNAADFQGKMFDLAQQTGVTVETLSALEIVARTTGGEIGTITQSLIAFQRKLDDAQDPLSDTGQLFRDLQINTSDTETALRSALTALAGMEVGFAQTNAAAELFGARGGKQMLAILKETNGNLDEAIKRFRELGILISEEDARAAAKLNSELAILDFQLRAVTGVIAKDLIPAVTSIVRSFGDLVTAARPIIGIFGSIAGSAAGGVASAFRGLRVVVSALTGDYIALAKAAKEANEEISAPPIPAQTTEGPKPTPLTTGIGPDIIAQTDAVVAAAKRAAETTNQALDELFQQGRRNRAQQGEELIAANKKVLDAERLQIEERIKLKDEEVKALREREDLGALERDKGIQEAFNEAAKLQEELRNKETQFALETRQIRLKVSKENADARRNQIANETDQLVGEFDRQIKEIESAIKRGETVESDGLTIIEQLEQGKIDARKESLEKQKEVGFLTIQAQEEINAEIRKVLDEGDRLRDEQRQRRLERERETAERTRDILISNLDALLEIERVQGEARIATLQTLAALRVKTEEDAAKEILRIRLDLIDSEIEATRAKLSAASSISDGGERERIEAELNNQIKILQAQRKATQEQGNRDIDGARQEDLDNAREYARDLEEIHIRIADIERDAAEEVLRLMVIHFASRRDIIRARLQLDLEDENARHRNALQGIAALRQENAESNRTKQEKLEVEKEINRLAEEEVERHRLRMKGIKDQGKKDEEEASPLGRLSLGKEQLKEFAAELEASIVPLNQILTDSFFQVANAIGAVVEQWVLLGETGPAVMRKILAQALAAIAKEAAINAIKELALGFAMLFINPAASGAHFTAAALWASIGGVAAITGRSVAGDLFKPKSSSASRDTSPPRPLDTVVERGRNQTQPPVGVQITVTHAEGMIVKTVVDDFNNGGSTRETFQRDGS